jgi:hypothetical protein
VIVIGDRDRGGRHTHKEESMFMHSRGIRDLSSDEDSPKGVDALVRERFKDAYAGVLRYLSPVR